MGLIRISMLLFFAALAVSNVNSCLNWEKGDLSIVPYEVIPVYGKLRDDERSASIPLRKPLLGSHIYALSVKGCGPNEANPPVDLWYENNHLNVTLKFVYCYTPAEVDLEIKVYVTVDLKVPALEDGPVKPVKE